MNRVALFAVAPAAFALAMLGGCSSSSSNSNGTGDDGGTGDDASSAPTWSTIYADYFASGTPGHCGNAGCHSSALGGFTCGSTKDSCYKGLVSAGLVSTTQKDKSSLASSGGVIVWFNSKGTMPYDNRKANAQAASDITAWLASGAENN